MIVDVVIMKKKKNITVFWDVTPYSLVDIYQCSGGMYRLCLQDRRPEDRGSRFL
jgi:hypothetical protein